MADQEQRLAPPTSEESVGHRREIFHFEEFEFRTVPHRLLRDGAPVPLQPQPAKALALLLTEAGSVVGRDDLREHLWGGSFLEYDQGINFAIRKIRQALDDDPANPRFLETIPKLGYRFIAPVRREPSSLSPAAARTSLPGRRWWLGMAALALPLIMLAVWAGSSRLRPSIPAEPVVAVFPLQVPELPGAAVSTLMAWPTEASEDRGEGLGAVLTEEWLFALTDVVGERVSLIAVDPSAGRDLPDSTLAETARTLGADIALRGQVAATSGDVAVALRMLRVADQASIWAHRFVITAGSRTDVLREAALGVQGALRLGPTPGPPVRPIQLTDHAYSQYLEGRFLTVSGAMRNDADTVARGVAMLEEVTIQAPSFGRAHAAIAHAHLIRLGLTAREPDVLAASAYARRALVLDPTLAEAHVVLGAISMYRDRNWQAARAAFERAIELQPGLSKTHRLHGSFLSAMGEHDDAVAALRRAVELDPTSSRALGALAEGYLFARDYARAFEGATKAAEVGPFNSAARVLKVHLRLLQQDSPGALDELTRGFDLEDSSPIAGVEHWHRQLVEYLQTLPDDANASFGTQAIYLTLLGEPDLALDALERARSAPLDSQLPFVAVDPRLDPLRTKPRFRALLAELGLTPRSLQD